MGTTDLFGVNHVTQAGCLGLSHWLGLHRLQLQRSLCWELWDHTGKKEMSHEEDN